MLSSLSMESKDPLYLQIKDKIKKSILDGTLKKLEQLPSVRSLAKELGVGVITTKRAYDELVLEGYIISKEAVGFFVADINYQDLIFVEQQKLKNEIKKYLSLSKEMKIKMEDLIQLIKEVYYE